MVSIFYLKINATLKMFFSGYMMHFIEMNI